MLSRQRRSAGFTLIELLLVIAVAGILIGIALPSSAPSLYDQLRSVCRIMATDLAYARSLAVANNSTYRVTFDPANNRYLLEHTGANSALNQLPRSPFASSGDPSTQYIVRLGELPHVGPTVRLAAAGAGTTSLQPVTSVEFGPLGATTRSSPTTVWLAAGFGAPTRYMSLSINPVTGLTEVGQFSSTAPPVGAAN